MAWFGESLSSLTGHLQNLTKEVLSEASDETKDAAGDVKATKEKLEELEAVCTAQDLEISALKKQNAELRRRLELAGCLEDEDQPVLPPAPTTWLSIEQRCDAGYAGGSKGHARALSDASAVAAKHQERLEKQLKERIQVIEHLQMQLQKVEEERHVLSQKTSELERQVQQLSIRITETESVNETNKSASHSEAKLKEENNELKTLLGDANERTRELEEELLNLRNQCLDHVIDSQARETEENAKRLQVDDQKLAAEMATKIQKLGDQEQQDLIHGTLKALELENQVLNMRNAQLERESLQDLEMVDGIRKSLPDGIENKSKVNETMKSEDDVDNLSELSDFTILSQRFENQIAQLQKQVETYKKDAKHYEMMHDSLSLEKSELEEQVQNLQNKLHEQQKLANTASQNIAAQAKLLEQDNAKYRVPIEKVKELQQELAKSKENMMLLHDEKQYLGQELKAMARVIQDLESKVATAEDERHELEANMEELDQQHQDALDKLLGLRNAELAENENLQFQIQELKLVVSQKPQLNENCAQTESSLSVHEEDSTQTDCIHQYDQENQTSFVNHDKETLTDSDEKKILNQDADFSFKYDAELSEKIKKLVNFDIPNDFNNTIPQSLYLVQEIVKIVNDCKWKKDTLERKVSELIRENREYKSTITILEAECSNLKDNVERLAEQLVGVAKASSDPLPTILENSEEIEQLEQKIAMLEEEVAVLRETRVNFEEDAVRMREEREDLLGKIRNLEAQQKNQENLQTELQRFADNASNSAQSYKAAVEAAESARMSAENTAKSLSHELQMCTQNYERQLLEIKEIAKNLDMKNKELVEDVMSKDAMLDQYQNNISELELEKNSLHSQLQENVIRLEEFGRTVEERRILQGQITDLQVQLHEANDVKAKLIEVSEELELNKNAKIDFEHQLELKTKSLDEAQLLIKQQEELEAEVKKWQNAAANEKLKLRDTLDSVFKLEEEKHALREKLDNEELSTKTLILKNEQLVKEIKDLTDCSAELVPRVNSEQLVENHKKHSQSEITTLEDDKKRLEQSLSSAKQRHDVLCQEIEALKSQLLEKDKTEAQLHRTISAMWTNDVNMEDKYEREFSGVVNKLREENKGLNLKLSAMECNETDGTQNDKLNSLELRLCVLLHEKENLMDENSKLKTALSNTSDKKCTNTSHKDASLQTDMPVPCGQSIEKGALNISELNQLQEEKKQILTLLEEKTCQVDFLQSELKKMSLTVETNCDFIKQLEQQIEVIMNEKSQGEDKFAMTKETVSKLSEIIKEKDQELGDLKNRISHLEEVVQRSDSVGKQLIQAQESIAQGIQERDQLLQTVHVKHQESVQYHAEIQRLSTLLGQELAKNQQLTAQYTTLVQQYNEEKANTSPKHQQEMKQLQDLMKVKDEGLQQLCNRLELKEQELQARGMEMEMLQHQIQLMAQDRMSQHAAQVTTGQQDENVQEKYKELLSKFQDEQRKCKNLQNDFEICQGREIALQRELERLRIHLVEIEDTYTQEALKSEEHLKELSTKLQQAEEMMKSSSTVYKSVNIRANQQVETLQEQARLIAQQRDDVQMKLSAAEDQVAKHSAALRNLQAVLEQFQRDREREVEAARASVFHKVEAAQKRHDELLGEIASLKLQLKEAKEGLSAASRLGEELDRKTEVVNRLKQEVVQLEEKVQKAQDEAKMVGQTVEGKVDKSLVKNVVLGFFLAPSNSKDQVLHVVASVLDFSEDEKNRVQKKLGLHSSEGSGGWFKSLLHPSSQDQSNSQSLSEAFVRFLENESIPQPKLRMLPRAEKQSTSNSNSPRATTPVTTQRKSPLLLADVQLPTFAQFPVGRNSSSILKDVLKES